MVRQNFQLQPIRKSSCLPFMFPEWQCRHIRGSLDSFSSSPFSSANSLFFSRARTWKIPLYSWLPIILHSSSVQSIAPRFYRSPETKPCSNLPRFDRISRTCTNIDLRQRSIADRLCNNPRSFVENKKREKSYCSKSLHFEFVQSVRPLSLTRFTSTRFFLPTKLTRTTFYSSTSGRNHRRRFVRESSTLGLAKQRVFTYLETEQLKERTAISILYLWERTLHVTGLE